MYNSQISLNLDVSSIQVSNFDDFAAAIGENKVVKASYSDSFKKPNQIPGGSSGGYRLEPILYLPIGGEITVTVNVSPVLSEPHQVFITLPAVAGLEFISSGSTLIDADTEEWKFTYKLSNQIIEPIKEGNYGTDCLTNPFGDCKIGEGLLGIHWIPYQMSEGYTAVATYNIKDYPELLKFKAFLFYEDGSPVIKGRSLKSSHINYFSSCYNWEPECYFKTQSEFLTKQSDESYPVIIYEPNTVKIETIGGKAFKYGETISNFLSLKYGGSFFSFASSGFKLGSKILEYTEIYLSQLSSIELQPKLLNAYTIAYVNWFNEIGNRDSQVYSEYSIIESEKLFVDAQMKVHLWNIGKQSETFYLSLMYKSSFVEGQNRKPLALSPGEGKEFMFTLTDTESIIDHKSIGDYWVGITDSNENLVDILATNPDTAAVESQSLKGTATMGGTSSKSVEIPDNTESVKMNLNYPGSDLDIHIYDDLGRHFGLNYSTGLIDSQIPGINYSGSDSNPETIEIKYPNNGTYRFLIYGSNVTDIEPFNGSISITNRVLNITGWTDKKNYIDNEPVYFFMRVVDQNNNNVPEAIATAEILYNGSVETELLVYNTTSNLFHCNFSNITISGIYDVKYNAMIPGYTKTQANSSFMINISDSGTPFLIKGVGYAPVPIGADPDFPPHGDYFTSDYKSIYNRDLPLLRQMGANTIRLWGWNNTADHTDFLNSAYNNGTDPIYVIVSFWMGPSAYPNISKPETRAQIKTDFRNMVAGHKDNPAVLMWAIGNELNAPWMYGNNLTDLFRLINEMAQVAHEEEGANYHPVTSPLADIDLINTIGAYNNTMTALDIWSVQIYRGNSFGTLFEDYKNVSGKPLIITEYGIDAYDNRNSTEYELIGTPYQAEYARALWNEIIVNSNITSGASIMAYSDEWWKGKYTSNPNPNPGCPESDPNFHSNCGYSISSHPDGYSNEEWWGIMRTRDNGSSPDIMEPRATYYALRSLWTNDTSPPASITNLTNITYGYAHINFTWLNPPDPDFSHIMLDLNGSFMTNVYSPQNYHNFTGLQPDTLYELSTHTVDTSGNINETWVNATARTLPSVALPPVADCGPSKLTCENVASPVQFNASASFDPDDAIVSYDWDFGDGTNGSGVAPVHTYNTTGWNGTAYQPFTVNLTVMDNEGMKNSTSINVVIWIPGDANGDGNVNILDASLVGLKWGTADLCTDLNNDGSVNILDASIIGLNWGKIPIIQ